MPKRCRTIIMNDILNNVSSQDQLLRLLDAYDKYPSIALALDNYNYSLARERVRIAKTDGVITEEDETLVLKYMVRADNEIDGVEA